MRTTYTLLGSLSALLVFSCTPSTESLDQCGDGVDNDNDGFVDCQDVADCGAAAACAPVAEICDNGIDDDNDGDVDCPDTDCLQDVACAVENRCDDQVDNDGDGLVDCADSECAGFAGCNLDPACLDGIDNDGDSLFDRADPGCQVANSAGEEDNQCADGVDNDFDGLVDSDDPRCQSVGFEADPSALPDLAIVKDRGLVFTNENQQSTPDGQPIFRTIANVDASNPEFLEGCLTGLGDRRVLKFNAVIANIGDADLIVGDTDQHRPIWSDVPNFGLIFKGWTRMSLRDSGGNTLASGHKGSFCMIDLLQINPQGQPKFFNCNNGQGISVGVADVYDVNLPCQYIDVTDIAPGNYTLHVETDFTKEIPEKNYNNNSIDLDVVVP